MSATVYTVAEATGGAAFDGYSLLSVLRKDAAYEFGHSYRYKTKS